MQVEILKSKLHRAVLTACELEYEGSLGIDQDLMDEVGLLPGEKILVVNQTNGARLVTYAIPSERGSLQFCLNGAAARLGQPGDRITIMSFALVTLEEYATHKPCVVVFDEANRIKSRK